MKNRTSQNSLPFLLLVLLGGGFFMFFLIFEYNENIKIIEGNKILLQQNIRERLISDIKLETNRYPDNRDELLSNWLDHSPELRWFYKKKLLFPFKHTVDKKSMWSNYWNIYQKYQTEGLIVESVERVNILKRLEIALKNNDKKKVRQGLLEFLGHKEHFQLTAIEEVVSSLRLVEIGQWQPNIVYAFLIAGFNENNIYISSVADLLLQESHQFSREDIEQATIKLSGFCEQANLSYSKVINFIDNLWKPKLNFSNLPDKGIWLQEGKFLIVTKNSDSHLVIPIIIEDKLNSIEHDLKQQSVLDKGDQILLEQSPVWSELSDLPISINKPSWNKAKQRQKLYFSIKVLLLLLLVALVIIAYRALQLRIERKQNYLKLRENFVNLVSHELKTPLSSIRLMAETLSKRLLKGQEPRDYPNRILMEADRLWIMVDNVLSFNRIQADMLTLNDESVNLYQLIENLLDEINENLSISVLVKNGIEEYINIYIDKLLISLVLKNLIINAVKYNKQSQVKLIFDFNVKSNILFMTDNGIGISEADKTKVFEDFYRCKKTQNQSGTGIGLSVSKKIMQLHDGDLSIKASSSEGTTWALNFLNKDD